jgi:hypothetical protein
MTTTPQQAGLSRHAFLNACRILHSMEPDFLTRKQRLAFQACPTEFLMRADEAALTKLWAEVQRRQPEGLRCKLQQSKHPARSSRNTFLDVEDDV